MKLTIGRKLALASIVVLFFMVVIAVSGVINLNLARRDIQALTESQEALIAIDGVVEKQFEERIALENFILTGDEQSQAELEQAIEAYDAAWLVVKDQYSGQFAQRINEVEQQRGAVLGILTNMLLNPELYRGDFEVVGVLTRYYENTLKPLVQLLRQEEIDLAQGISEGASNRSITMLATASLVSIIAIVISIWASYTISRGISSAVVHLSEAANSISRGEMDVEIEVETGDEMQTLAESIERMRVSLKAAIERLRAR